MNRFKSQGVSLPTISSAFLPSEMRQRAAATVSDKPCLAVQSVQARLRVIPKGLAMTEAYPGCGLYAPGRGRPPHQVAQKMCRLSRALGTRARPRDSHRGLSG